MQVHVGVPPACIEARLFARLRDRDELRFPGAVHAGIHPGGRRRDRPGRQLRRGCQPVSPKTVSRLLHGAARRLPSLGLPSLVAARAALRDETACDLEHLDAAVHLERRDAGTVGDQPAADADPACRPARLEAQRDGR